MLRLLCTTVNSFFPNKNLQNFFFKIKLFSNNFQKNFFPLHVCKVLFSKPDVCNLLPAISNSAAHGHELLVYLGTRSKMHDVSWLF